MVDGPILSVVIPTCHRNDALALCLARLAPGAQTFPASRYEVIVTDDGSQCTAHELVNERFAWARWTQGPRRGPAANRNHGALLAGGDWLVFTDDDCLPDQGWLAAISDAARGGARAIEGAVHPVGDPNTDLAECPVNLAGGLFWSANIAVERRLFVEVGGFDERFTMAAHEDEDLQLRLSERTPIAFVPGARVEHPVRTRSLGARLRTMRSAARNTALYYALNAERLGIRRYSTLARWVWKPRLVALRDHALHARPRSALETLAWMLWGNPMIMLDAARLRRSGASSVQS